jgi:sec-independent protein translocase protein TatC
MTKSFPYAILAAFVISAIITPTPDIITQGVVAVPMIVLYALSILIALVVGRNKERRKQKQDAALETVSDGEKDDLAG